MAQTQILMTRNAATRCVLQRYNAANAIAPLGPLAGFKGAASRLGGGEEREERGREREKRAREGGEGEGKLTLMCSLNRAADWLRPALIFAYNVMSNSGSVDKDY